MLKRKKFNFFPCGGLCSPTPPTGAAPLDPAWFWVEDSSRNRFALKPIHSQFKDSNSSKNIKMGGGGGGIFLVFKEFFLEEVWRPPQNFCMYAPDYKNISTGKIVVPGTICSNYANKKYCKLVYFVSGISIRIARCSFYASLEKWKIRGISINSASVLSP